MQNNIISLSGRKSSGKTECAKELEKNGYIILNFSDSLKELICELLNIKIETLEFLKNSEKFKYILTEKQLKHISNVTDIKYVIVKKVIGFKQRTIRNLLQIIGTQLIRSCNPDWHINKLAEKINLNTKYCIPDTRFLNEKKYIEYILNGKCYFIIRNDCNINVSNHISEKELNWKHFQNNIIINDSSKDNLIKTFNKTIHNQIDNKINLNFLKSTMFMELNHKNAFLAGYIFNNIKIKSSLSPFISENYKLWFPSNKRCPDIINEIKDIQKRNEYYRIWLSGIFSFFN